MKGDAWQAVIERKLPDYVVPGLKTLPNGKVISPPVPRGRKPGDKIYENQSQLTVMGGESVAEHYHFEKHQKYFLGSPVVSRPDLPPYSAQAARLGDCAVDELVSRSRPH